MAARKQFCLGRQPAGHSMGWTMACTSKRLMASFAEWMALTFVWMLLVGTWSASELGVGLGAAALATLGSRVVRKCSAFRFGFSGKAIAEGWRIPGYALSGSWELFQALGRQLFTRRGAESLLRAVAFAPGQDDPASRTRCALAIAYTCSTPNFVVLGIDERNRLLVFHQVKRGGVLRMTQALGAKGDAP